MFNFEIVFMLFVDNISHIINNSLTIIFYIYTLLYVLRKTVYTF